MIDRVVGDAVSPSSVITGRFDFGERTAHDIASVLIHVAVVVLVVGQVDLRFDSLEF